MLSTLYSPVQQLDVFYLIGGFSVTSSTELSSLREPGRQTYSKANTPWLLYAFTSLAALGGFLFGYDTGIISGAIILLRKVGELTTHSA